MRELGLCLLQVYLLLFVTLSNHFDLVPFLPTNFVWKSQVPLKVLSFAWLVAYKKVNTNDML